ncbi:MAG: hypothetical protein LBI05_00155 [Planctomycetaceae bacterium]|jgi:hypothetical protein|nr:hypothetical protein [Planctomycetaceae bacterium]
MNSRWQDIDQHLRSKGFDVYAPGMKSKDCTFPYIVVKQNGSTRKAGFSTDIDLYSVLVYIPQQNYSELEVLIQRVKAAMKELEPMILPVRSQTPSYYEDAIKAHMVSVEYMNNKTTF